jgi:hypothetical protein
VSKIVSQQKTPQKYWTYQCKGYLALVDFGRFFQCHNPYTVGRTPWTGDEAIVRPLPTDRTTHTDNKGTQASMTRVGFEPTIPVFERATVIGLTMHIHTYLFEPESSVCSLSILLSLKPFLQQISVLSSNVQKARQVVGRTCRS